MQKMSASTAWAIARSTDMPNPIGSPVFSLTTLNLSNDLPMLDPVVPWR